MVVPIVALAIQGGPQWSKFELVAFGALMGVLVAVPLTYLAVLFIGYPAYKLLLRLGWLNAFSLCSVGCMAGAAGGYIFAGVDALILTASCGLAVAFVAWLFLRNDLRNAVLSHDPLAEEPHKSVARDSEG